eukprot:gene24156-30469_t
MTANIENYDTGITNVVHRTFPGILLNETIVGNPTTNDWFTKAPVNAVYFHGPYVDPLTGDQVVSMSSRKSVLYTGPKGDSNQRITFVTAGLVSLSRIARAICKIHYTDSGFGAVMRYDSHEMLAWKDMMYDVFDSDTQTFHTLAHFDSVLASTIDSLSDAEKVQQNTIDYTDGDDVEWIVSYVPFGESTEYGNNLRYRPLILLVFSKVEDAKSPLIHLANRIEYSDTFVTALAVFIVAVTVLTVILLVYFTEQSPTSNNRNNALVDQNWRWLVDRMYFKLTAEQKVVMSDLAQRNDVVRVKPANSIKAPLRIGGTRVGVDNLPGFSPISEIEEALQPSEKIVLDVESGKQGGQEYMLVGAEFSERSGPTKTLFAANWKPTTTADDGAWRQFRRKLSRHLQLSVYEPINEQDKDGVTALHIATWNCNIKIMVLLLFNHAEVMVADRYGRTALHYAVMRGHATAANLLVDSLIADAKTPSQISEGRRKQRLLLSATDNNGHNVFELAASSTPALKLVVEALKLHCINHNVSTDEQITEQSQDSVVKDTTQELVKMSDSDSGDWNYTHTALRQTNPGALASNSMQCVWDESNTSCSETPTTQNVDRVRTISALNITAEMFQRDYFSAQRPLLITDNLTSSSDIWTHSTKNAFTRKYGHILLRTVDDSGVGDMPRNDTVRLTGRVIPV